jgi:predicted metal-dependent TIM-barrel fold hydrolase
MASQELLAALQPKLDETQLSWLRESSDLSGERLLAAFVGAGRRLGAHRLEGRVFMLVSLDERDSSAQTWITRAYREGDSREKKAVLAALPHLSQGEAYLSLALDAGRTNESDLFATLALRNAYPSSHYSDHEFNQLVMKAAFGDMDLSQIVDLERRHNSELARMGMEYIDERLSAQRSFPESLWLAIAPENPPGAVARMLGELHHSQVSRRLAAAGALSLSRDPRAIDFLEERLQCEPDEATRQMIEASPRTTDDYEAMYRAGVRAVLEPAFWLGQPRTQAGSFIDYFNSLIGWERFRAKQFGIAHFCTMALNPKESNDAGLAREVLDMLPRFLEKEGVLGVGEIGYDDVTRAEEASFREQLQLAKELGVIALVHLPHRDKKRGTERTLDLVREVGIPEHMVLIDHNTEETLPLVLDTACWAGHSIYPETKMSEERMVALVKQYGTGRIIINSAADWGKSDPLKVPKTASAMRSAGISEADIETIVWGNPVEFFSQGGRLAAEDLQVRFDQSELFEGNSVLRGQTPSSSES